MLSDWYSDLGCLTLCMSTLTIRSTHQSQLTNAPSTKKFILKFNEQVECSNFNKIEVGSVREGFGEDLHM